MQKEKTAKRKILRRIVLILLAVIVLLCAGFVGYCMLVEKPAAQSVAAYGEAFGSVAINVTEDGGVELMPQSAPLRDTAIIFYVGAQIEPRAYIPLLARLAGEGYRCFIPELSFNLAIMEKNAAEAIISAHPEIGSWVLAGHSLGGLTAADFADSHPDEVDGLILLAAYPNSDMSDASLPTLSVFGDCDGVLNRELYEKRLSWEPADFEEQIIAGANHSQFGDYGKQPRDNEALIGGDEQQAQTASIILDWLSRNDMAGGSNGQNTQAAA